MQLFGRDTESQLRAHLETVDACASERASSSVRTPNGRRDSLDTLGMMPTYTAFGRHVTQQARGDGERRTARVIIEPVDQHTLWRRHVRRQHEHFGRTVLQQPFDLCCRRRRERR